MIMFSNMSSSSCSLKQACWCIIQLIWSDVLAERETERGAISLKLSHVFGDHAEGNNGMRRLSMINRITRVHGNLWRIMRPIMGLLASRTWTVIKTLFRQNFVPTKLRSLMINNVRLGSGNFLISILPTNLQLESSSNYCKNQSNKTKHKLRLDLP